MGKTFKSSGGGNKAARMAQKEEAVASKLRAEREREDEEEDVKWRQGSRQPNKKDEQAAKRASQRAEKMKRDALAAAEDAELPDAPPSSRRSKQAEKKSKAGPIRRVPTLDSDDEDEESMKLATVNATGIDNALDALGLDDDVNTNTGNNKVERHPERRFGPAFERYYQKRIEEMKTDGTGDGLRGNQRRALIRKEFERHEDNPFNQQTANYNATKDELREIRHNAAAAIEDRLADHDDD